MSPQPSFATRPPDRATSRGTAHVVISATFAAIALVAAGAGMLHRAHPRSAGFLSDTLVINGPKRFDAPVARASDSLPISYDFADSFTVTMAPTHRYLVRVTNGEPDGSARIIKGTVNGVAVDAQVAVKTFAIAVRQSNVLVVSLAGQPQAGHLTVEVLDISGGNILVFGMERFSRDNGAAVAFRRDFTVGPSVGAPFFLWVVNGNADGSQRLSNATLTLNGDAVLGSGSAALATSTPALMQAITPVQGPNHLEIVLPRQAAGFIEVGVTGTDITPPKLTVTTPAPGLITRDTTAAVTGTVTDASAVAVTVNGVVATRSGNNYSATVPLAEGSNVLKIGAVDASGARTDSSRTVIRDRQVPVLTLSTPPDGFGTDQASIALAGTVIDRTATTVNVNGVQLPVNAAGAFSGSAPLSVGSNVLTVSAADAAGNTKTVVRTGTRNSYAYVPNSASLTGITQTLLTSGFNATNLSVYTTASIAPAANTLITVAVLGRRSTGAQTPTITGGGMSTWTLVGTVDFDPISGPLSRVSVFRALSSSPGSGALTITFASSQSNATWVVSQWGGVDVSGTNGAGAIVQSNTANGDAVTSLSKALNAFGSTSNVAYGVVGVGMNGPAVTPGSGFTEIAEPTSGESNLLEAEWGVNLPTVSASWGSAKNAGLFAMEIKAAAGSGGITQTLLTSGTNTTNQTVYTTASISPAANALITVAVLGRRVYGAVTPSITGGGMTTWTLVASVDFDAVSAPLSRISVFRAMRSAPSSGPLTITFPHNVSNATWIVSQWTGVDTSGGNGVGAIVQIASAHSDAVSSLSTTLNALASTNDAAFGVVAVGLNGPVVTPGTGLTEIAEPSSGENNLLEAEWGVNKTAVSASWTPAKNAGLLGFEIKAGGGASGGVFATQSTVTASPTSFVAGSGSSTITVTAKDALGNPVSGATVVLSATGVGNTLTQPSGPTNSSGVATGTLSSTVSEVKTVSATANGISIAQTATVTVTSGSGSGQIAHTLLTSGTNATNLSVYTTASIAPAAKTLITVAVLGRRSTGAQTPTITGGGMSTWTLVGTVDYDPISGPLSRVSVFRAMSSTPGSGALTITFASSQSNATWIVSQWSGADTTGTNGAGAIVQNVTARGDAVSSLSATLNALASSSDVAFGVVGAGLNGPAVTPGTGFTEIAEPTSGESNLLEAEWGVNLTTVSASWGSAKNAGLFAMEIKAAPASGGGGSQPPGVTAIDPTVPTTVGPSTAFLYSGSNPIQTGVAPGTIDPLRVTVLRGKVLSRDGQPVPGVGIAVVSHPEFGQTVSRSDGMFDMAVNGGGLLTVEYTKSGYLSVQRTTKAPWQDYAIVDDVVLSGLDTTVTAIDFSQPMEVARGSIVSDTDGTRRATLLFKQGTQATMVLANGSTQPLSTIHVRATEFTVGPTGPAAMPAELPPTSAYTYAVEYTVDEALSAGARDVQFSQPVVTYVENLLAFPVGLDVPAGYYDRQAAKWVPAANGRVIKILSFTNGRADVDVTGSGVPSDSATLASLGVTDVERAQLAQLYSSDQTLWRVPVTHFTTWDYNWPYTAGRDALPPPPVPPQFTRPTDDEHCHNQSIIECENQVLREQVPITGTPFEINYNSSRVSGYQAGKALHVSISGPTIPSGLERIVLMVDVAGKRTVDTFPPVPNQVADFIWDGLDAYGRTIPGAVTATVRVNYVYDAVYTDPVTFAQAFAWPSDVAVTPDPGQGGGASTIAARDEATIAISREFRTLLGPWASSASAMLGGWTLDVHHAYDPVNQRLYMGDGTQRSASNIALVIQTFAGGGPGCSSGCAPNGDGGPATQASIGSPVGLAVAPDGSVYIAERQFNRIRKVGVDGIITTVAGNGSISGFGGDGGPATQAMISSPSGIALAPDGSFYIADLSNQRIRRVGPDGIITTVAGTGSFGFSGDGGQATLAQLFNPTGVAIGPDGSLYIADQGNQRVRRVSPSGIINTFAGNGSFCTTGFLPPDSFPSICGEGVAATSAKLANPTDVAVALDGSVLIADQGDNHIRRVGKDGIITTAAGSAAPSGTGDGGPATAAGLSLPRTVNVGPDGSFYIGDGDNNSQDVDKRVRRVGPDGIITTVVGNGIYGFTGDGGPAPQAEVKVTQGVAVAPDGSLYISDTDNNRVRRVQPALPGSQTGSVLLSSADGGELYQFDGNDKHQRTLGTVTGDTIYKFAYDTAGRLSRAIGLNGDTITIERDANGAPTGIVAPHGQRTTLAINTGGYLATVTNPAGEAIAFGYGSGGLLSSMTDPRGHTSRFTYDSLGRLVSDSDAAGSVVHLATVRADSVSEVTFQSALGRIMRYRIEPTSDGGTRRTIIDTAGLITTTVIDPAGRVTGRLPSGDSIALTLRPDARWGMQAAGIDSLWVKTPSGLKLVAKSRGQATLSNPVDPLSLVSLVDSIALNGKWATRSYDAATRRLVVTSAEGRQYFARLDAQGRLVEAQPAGLDSIMFTYNGLGQMIQVRTGGRSWSYTYDSHGRPLGTVDPLGRVDSLFYDSADRISRHITPGHREIDFAYDSSGNVIGISPPGRPTHSFLYSAVNFDTAYVPPSLGAGNWSTRFRYTLDRQLRAIVRPSGDSITLAYEATTGRLSAVTFDRGQLGYAYDAATGALTRITAPGNDTLSFTYDGSMPTSVSWAGPVTGSIGFAYNNDLRERAEAVNGSDTISYTYDRDGLITKVGDLGIKSSSSNGLIQRDSIGGVLGVSGYDTKGALSSYTTTYSGNSLYQSSYTRDSLSRVTQLAETVQGVTITRAFTYDSVGRLATVTENGQLVRTYTYDPNGNRLSVVGPGLSINGGYDNQDRLLSYGTSNYAYTSNGELSLKVVGTDTTRYIYDALGNVTQVTLPGGTLIEYVIDAQGRRIGKKVNGVLQHAWLWRSQLAPAVELNGNGAVVSRFAYATRPNVPDYMIKAGQTYRLVLDHLGSVRLVVNTADGSVAQRIDYDEFGRVTQNTNPGFQPFGFGGGLFDEQSGLVRLGARDYDASTGRWTTKDPLLFGGGDPNLYSYVLSDPINISDRSGELLPLIGAIMLVGGLVNGTIDAIRAIKCGESFGSVLGQFGKGFAAGALGSGIGAFLGIYAGFNPIVAGAGASAATTWLDDMFNGRPTDFREVVLSGALGGIFGPVAADAAPTVGRIPSLLTTKLGPNSQRLITQEIVSDVSQSPQGLRPAKCGCKN